jgi:type 1 fimbria pilin
MASAAGPLHFQETKGRSGKPMDRNIRFPGNVRRLSALVSLALTTGLPFAASAEAPTVTWKAPLGGAVLSGTISGSTCTVDASSSIGMDVVSFWINDYQIGNDYRAQGPFNCTFDTKMLQDGPYTLWVQAYSSKREVMVSQIPVTIRNSAAPTPTPTPTPAPTPTPTPTPTPGVTPAPGAGALDVWFNAPLVGSRV